VPFRRAQWCHQPRRLGVPKRTYTDASPSPTLLVFTLHHHYAPFCASVDASMNVFRFFTWCVNQCYFQYFNESFLSSFSDILLHSTLLLTLLQWNHFPCLSTNNLITFSYCHQICQIPVDCFLHSSSGCWRFDCGRPQTEHEMQSRWMTCLCLL
jgi:hypothetical protein